ncbi:MAG TPA: STAS/SEC14 domain-containing protein [Sphingobium sp.]
MYDYSFHHDLNLLDIAWKGPFTPELVQSYARGLLVRFAQEGFAPGYRLRMDMSGSATQPQDALPIFAAEFRDFPKAERIAVITASAIARLQVKRVMTQPYLRIFGNADEGLAWLLGRIYVAPAG